MRSFYFFASIRENFLWLCPTAVTLALFVALSSCAPRLDDDSQGPKHRDSLTYATKLIDGGNFSSAIEICNEVLAAGPNERASHILASAHSGRAGITVEKYWGFLVGYDGWVDADKRALQFSLQPASLLQSQELQSLLLQLSKWSHRFEAIPILSASAQTDLQMAVATLERTQRPGSRLFRALLGVILIRTDLETHRSLVERLRIHSKSLCVAQNPAESANGTSPADSAPDAKAISIVPLRNMLLNFVDVLLDLSRAFPSQIKMNQTNIEELAQIKSWVQVLNRVKLCP